MRPTQVRTGLAVAATSLLAATALAQDGGQPPRGYQDRADSPPVLFFTDEIIDRAIDRITEEMAAHYKFDEDQLWNTREVIKARFPQFIRENRDQLIIVFNQYIAAMLGADPPGPEEVADWAQRVQPLLHGFSGLADEIADEMRSFMTEEQQLKFDGERAMFRVGMEHVKGRLAVWAQGGYDWESEWPRSKAFKETQAQREAQLREEQRRARDEVLGVKPQPTGVEPAIAVTPGPGSARPGASPATSPAPRFNDEWVAYVDNFIKRYQLDESQQTAARRILRRYQGDRDRYLQRKASEIEALEKRLKEAKGEEEREKVRGEYERVNEPVARLFRLLKDKLEALPTRKQRADAARAELEARAQAEEKTPAKKD